MPMTKTNNDTRELTYENSEGVEVTVELAQKWEICPDCSGNGKHDHPAFANGVEQDILDDEDSSEAYFRGDYDVRCEYCDGEGKTLEVDFDSIKDEEVREAYESECDNARWDDAERESERRMGC